MRPLGLRTLRISASQRLQPRARPDLQHPLPGPRREHQVQPVPAEQRQRDIENAALRKGIGRLVGGYGHANTERNGARCRADERGALHRDPR